MPSTVTVRLYDCIDTDCASLNLCSGSGRAAIQGACSIGIEPGRDACGGREVMAFAPDGKIVLVPKTLVQMASITRTGGKIRLEVTHKLTCVLFVSRKFAY